MSDFVANAIAGIVGEGPTGRRLAARCTDVAIAALVASAVLMGGIVALGDASEGRSATIDAGPFVALWVVGLIVSIVLVAALDLGRRLFRLRLIRADGQAAAFPKRFARDGMVIALLILIGSVAVVQPLAGAVVAGGYLGLLWYTISKGRTRRVDRLLGTRVVERAT